MRTTNRRPGMALASVVALVFLLGVTQAQTVDVEGTNVTGIQNLPIFDQFGSETIYNVQFVDTTANDLYGPDLDFDFFDADDATLGALTVIATLNDETLVLPTPSGAGSGGSHQFFVGADVQDLGLIGAYGGEFFALGDPPTTLPNTWGPCDKDAPGQTCIAGVTALPQDETFTYASFTVVSDLLLGDVNLDDSINGLDVDPFVVLVTEGTYQAEGDMNEDDAVNGLDVDPFVAAVVGGAAAVPEPSTIALAALALLALVGFNRRRNR